MGRNFRVFRVFDPNLRKFMPGEISKQKNAKFFSRQIIDDLKNAKVFSREKVFFFKHILEAPYYKKNQRHMNYVYKVSFYSVYSPITTTLSLCFFFHFIETKKNYKNKIKKSYFCLFAKVFRAKLNFFFNSRKFFPPNLFKKLRNAKVYALNFAFFLARENFCPRKFLPLK